MQWWQKRNMILKRRRKRAEVMLWGQRTVVSFWRLSSYYYPSWEETNSKRSRSKFNNFSPKNDGSFRISCKFLTLPLRIVSHSFLNPQYYLYVAVLVIAPFSEKKIIYNPQYHRWFLWLHMNHDFMALYKTMTLHTLNQSRVFNMHTHTKRTDS